MVPAISDRQSDNWYASNRGSAQYHIGWNSLRAHHRRKPNFQWCVAVDFRSIVDLGDFNNWYYSNRGSAQYHIGWDFEQSHVINGGHRPANTVLQVLGFDHIDLQNPQSDYYFDITLGGALASKALVVDANKDIGSIRTLDAQNLNGSIKVSGTLGDFGSIKIGGTDVITSSRHIQNIGNIACSGTMNASAGIQINSINLVDASRNISAASLSTAGDITCSGLINGFLGYGNQSNITSLGLLTEANIGASNPNNAVESNSGHRKKSDFKWNNFDIIECDVDRNSHSKRHHIRDQ
ncbi:unnamed protein product [Phytophthora lilii]|uniref:Unnamed protein product n=1 Tax=Phytophthora lilii TaxID=2077276 RepID=A0A9W7CV92_9STRA|nr:unnamed protein product [Phytophthora lilii]